MENFSDGIDELRQAVKSHIDHCVINRIDWVTDTIPIPEPTYRYLSTLLLQDSMHTRPFVERIKACLYKDTSVVEEYKKRYFNFATPREIIEFLNKTINQYNLSYLIPEEDYKSSFQNLGIHKVPAANVLIRYILEFFIRDRINQEVQATLYEVADTVLYPELMLSRFSDDTFA